MLGVYARYAASDRSCRTWYFFGDNNRSGWTEFFATYVQPTYFTQQELLSGKEATLSFGIGASGCPAADSRRRRRRFRTRAAHKQPAIRSCNASARGFETRRRRRSDAGRA